MNEEIKNEEVNQEQRVMLMAVAFDRVKNTYYVDLGRGSNVAETAFAVSVVIKCLLKDGIIEHPSQFTTLVDKYLNDPQYDELKEDGDN